LEEFDNHFHAERRFRAGVSKRMCMQRIRRAHARSEEVMMTKTLALTVASCAFALGASLVPAQAASGVKVGVLTCSEAPSTGFIIGSSADLSCRFDPSDGRSQMYTGHVSKLGLDIGHLKGGTLTWAVFAPASNLKPGVLQGTYGGLTAGVALGAGIGANAMIGGFDRSIQLQPLSVEGLSGAEIAAGVGSIDLKYRG
jgi:hypothetical protein